MFIYQESLEDLISSKKNILLIGHFNPDGDSVGAVVGFYYYLHARGKMANMITPNEYPDFLRFLNPKTNEIIVYENNKKVCNRLFEDADLIICLDFNRLKRTEWMAEKIEKSKAAKVLIDHHPDPETDKFDIIISYTKVSSTCELLFNTLMKMPDIKGNAELLSMECAIALYTGIMTDTNNFSNSVYPSTFEMAALLLKRGVDKDKLQNEVFCTYSEERMRLMGLLLEKRMKVIPELGAAYILLSSEDKKNHLFKPGDSEGFVNMPLAIKGVKIVILLSENDEFIRVSLRSKGEIDVNVFSKKYCNGGGHRNASGGRLYIPLSETEEYLEKCLKEFFNKK